MVSPYLPLDEFCDRVS